MPEKLNERRTRTADEAFAALARLCARAEKSSGDALRLMRQWGVEESERGGVLRKLQQQRFIDDGRYAAAFVRDKTVLSGWGPYKIRTALTAKGIDRSIIDEALAVCPCEKMHERLEKQLRRKLGAITDGTPCQRRAKLLRYGLSLGYEYGAVTDAVEQFVKEEL